MAVEYTFAAHPTTYGGVRFRSRLEANWAAFFDQLGWQWEYEPFDLKGWVPDFLIRGKFRDALVEVKPITKPDSDTIQKICDAAGRAFNLFLCGVSPIPDGLGSPTLKTLYSCCCCDHLPCNWQNRFISQFYKNKYDIIFGHGSYTGFVTGFDVGEHVVDEFMGREVDELWAKAKNSVQWRAPR